MMRTLESITQATQRQLGEVIRQRVAGDEAVERGRLIWETPGPRWFSPSDPIWRVHNDASMYPGGVCALLLQSLHPLAMAGVAGHSGYKSDPWGRLQRTSNYLATTTFGTIEMAEEIIATVRAVHERVRGKDERGRSYRASDPHLLRWVAVAETYAFLTAYQVYAAAPLSAADADRYVQQAVLPAGRLGATELPSTVAELHEQLDAFRTELEPTAAAREAARFLLLSPPLPVAARAGYGLLAAGGVALLPGWARRDLGLSWAPTQLTRSLGTFGTAAVRWGLGGLRDEPSHRDEAGAERQGVVRRGGVR